MSEPTRTRPCPGCGTIIGNYGTLCGNCTRFPALLYGAQAASATVNEAFGRGATEMADRLAPLADAFERHRARFRGRA